MIGCNSSEVRVADTAEVSNVVEDRVPISGSNLYLDGRASHFRYEKGKLIPEQHYFLIDNVATRYSYPQSAKWKSSSTEVVGHAVIDHKTNSNFQHLKNHSASVHLKCYSRDCMD